MRSLLLLAPLFLAALPQGKAKAPKVEPGKVALRKAANGWTYALAVPKSYDPKKGARAIVILHGSNMSGRAYVDTIVAAGWFPDDLLLGPDGPNPGGSPDAHNFDEGSAPGVAAVFDEVAKEWKVTKAFVGGHSQGGFLTWDVFMNYPDRFAGAFPMAGGLWMRSEPENFEEARARAQREVAIAAIHGKADPVVEFSMSEYAVRAFLDAGFPKVRLFAPEKLEHQFGLSPVPEAVAWLEAMTSSDAALLLRAAKEAREEGRHGDAAHLAALAEKEAKEEGARAQAKAIAAAAEKAAAEAAKRIAPKIAGAKDGSFVEEFLAFRETCRGSKAALPAIAAYEALRKKQKGRGDALWAEARAAFDRGEEAKGREACAKIVAEAFATRWYTPAKRALDAKKKG